MMGQKLETESAGRSGKRCERARVLHPLAARADTFATVTVAGNKIRLSRVVCECDGAPPNVIYLDKCKDIDSVMNGVASGAKRRDCSLSPRRKSLSASSGPNGEQIQTRSAPV